VARASTAKCAACSRPWAGRSSVWCACRRAPLPQGPRQGPLPAAAGAGNGGVAARHGRARPQAGGGPAGAAAPAAGGPRCAARQARSALAGRRRRAAGRRCPRTVPARPAIPARRAMTVAPGRDDPGERGPKRILLALDALDMSGVPFSAQNLMVGLARSARRRFSWPGPTVNGSLSSGASGCVRWWPATSDSAPRPRRLRGGAGVPPRHRARPVPGGRAPQPLARGCPRRAAGGDREPARLDRGCLPRLPPGHRRDRRLGRHPGEARQYDGIARDRVRVIPNGLDLAQFPRPAWTCPQPRPTCRWWVPTGRSRSARASASSCARRPRSSSATWTPSS